MTPDERRELAEEWERNEAEIARLLDQLPTGATDPATRHQQLQRRQDEIEFELGMDPPEVE